MKSQSFLRDTALFILLFVCVVVGAEFFIAAMGDGSTFDFIDVSSLFGFIIVLFVWWLMYPKHSTESDE
jgi:Ca2+/Na+ antiporter